MKTKREVLLGTYNIRLAIQGGVQAIAQTIKSGGVPDILAIQEVGKDWTMGPAGDTTKELARALELPHFIYVPALKEAHPSGKEANYGHALLSRWPIQNVQTTRLPQRADEQRMLLTAQVETPFGPITIVSTHLSHRSTDRPDQGLFLLNQLSQKSMQGPRFLMGDLNATDEEEWLQTLLDNWEDADGELQRPTYPAQTPTRRIDYILGQGATCLEASVIKERAASDHRPLLSRWRF